jgi:putative flippase GtrA
VRLARFNLSTGAVSIAANLLLMRLLVGRLHVQYLLANLLSIAAASVANFLLSDLLVFRE